MNKRRLSQASLLRLPICFFPGREKAKWFRLRICFFWGREKAKWFRLPICFFPGREKAKRPDFHFAFSRPGKKQNGSDFPANLLFPGRGKSKMYQTCSLESCLETSSTCGTQTHDLLLMSLAPYPLGHSSLNNMLFPGFTKENWMSNLLFRLKLPICFFPQVTTALYAHLQP